MTEWYEYLVIPVHKKMEYNKRRLGQLGREGWILITAYQEFFYLAKIHDLGVKDE